MADYKILLGTQLDLSDIVSQINAAESKIDPIKIKVDAETKELTKSIQDALKTLSKSGNNALTLDTSKFEGSIADIKTAVVDLKKVLGSLDDSANMKSLLASVNQIANAIGKVTDESESLVKSLSILSKKDFGFNFNLKTGNANPLKANIDYGKEARRKTIPVLQEQAAYLQNLLGGYQDADRALERYLTKIHKAQGVSVKNNLIDDMSDSSNLSKQMESIERYIGYLKKIAEMRGIGLDGFESQFSKAASDIVDDTHKIQTGAKQTEEALEAVGKEMKQIFGSGIGAEQLSVQLDPIVSDLNQIREAVQNLSKGVSLDGLTGSFDRLSTAIENLLTNAERVKGVLGSGFDGSKLGSTSATQQVGKKVGETVKQSVKQSLTLDDVIDEQVSNLMSQYGIKGKKAFEEIRQAVVEYRKELQLANNIDFTPNINDPFGFDDDFGSSADIRKVMDAITHYIGKVPNLEKSTNEENLQGLWQEITRLNSDAKKGGTKKVHLPDTIRQEYGKDFARMRSQMGAAFTTGAGQDFESWCMEINGQLGNVIDLSRGAEAAFEDLLKKWQLRKDSDFVSGDDIFKKGGYDSSEMIGSIDASIDAINQKELEFAQDSKQTANTVSQSQEQIRQEYEETRRLRDEVDRAIDDYAERISNPDESKGFIDIDELEEYRDKMVQLEQVRDNLTTKMQSLESQLQGSDMSNNFKEVDIAIGNAEDEVSSLESALKRLGVSDNNIESITQEIKELGVTAKSVTATLGADDSISFSIKGIDEVKNAVTLMNSIDADGNLGGFSQTVSQNVDEVADSFERLKAIAKEINSLNIDVIKLNDTDNIDKAISKLDQLENEYKELYAQSSGSLDNSQIKELDKIAEQGRQAIAKLKKELSEKISPNLGIDGKFATQIQNITTDAKQLSGVTDELQAQIRSLDVALDAMNLAKENGDVDALISSWKNYKSTLESVENQLKQLKIAQKDANAEAKANQSATKLRQDADNLSLEMSNWLKNNSAAAREFGESIRELQIRLKSCDSVEFTNIKGEFRQIRLEAEATGKAGMTAFDRLKTKFKEYSTYLSAAEVFMWVEQGLRDMFEQVKLIDSAMTELKKVTDETDASYNQFLSNAASRSKELGTTIDGLVSSTADFARLGYGFEDSQGLAEVANIYAVVGDEIEGVEGATESLISTMAAFKAEANGLSESDFALNIVDKFNEVSNNYAISSGGLGEALKRSASALFSANNTLDESIAMITASNTVVQDASVVGNAYKTIALRIRGAKSELEEMGEDTSDMAESSSKLREELLALSGVDILEADGQTFKSTYDILDEISKVYHDLSDLSQANILEKLAGKRQSNILSAALENFDIARNALETSMGSSGSAMREHAKWSESLEADSCLVA